VILFNERKAGMLAGRCICAAFCSVAVLQTFLLRSDAYLRAALAMCLDVHSVFVCVCVCVCVCVKWSLYMPDINTTEIAGLFLTVTYFLEQSPS
jgi:hypothetical protein